MNGNEEPSTTKEEEDEENLPRPLLGKRAGKPNLSEVEMDLKKKKLEKARLNIANVFETQATADSEVIGT